MFSLPHCFLLLQFPLEVQCRFATAPVSGQYKKGFKIFLITLFFYLYKVLEHFGMNMKFVLKLFCFVEGPFMFGFGNAYLSHNHNMQDRCPMDISYL